MAPCTCITVVFCFQVLSHSVLEQKGSGVRHIKAPLRYEDLNGGTIAQINH